jgi:hypothetical protein
MSLISNPSFLAASQNNLSLGATWDGALSCCIYIGLLASSCGHFTRIAGKAFSIKNSRHTPFLIDSIGFISIAPALQFLLRPFSWFVSHKCKASNFAIKSAIVLGVKSWTGMGTQDHDFRNIILVLACSCWLFFIRCSIIL